jgi:CRISPR type III-associated protein (TIGR04423 family)
MEPITKHHSLETLPDLNYQGFIWLSDADKPIVLQNEPFDLSKIKTNPFIIEALLFNAEKEISIHIQHTGNYQITEYHFNRFDNAEVVDNEYLPHRLDGVSKVKFKQIWISRPDENCAGMEVLNLKAIVFCGFKN